MDILDNYEIIKYKPYDKDKYTNEHRTDSVIYYKNGLIHRDNDDPAIINTDGSQYWYCNGKLHRSCDNPAIIDRLNQKYWYYNGQLHRDSGPAVITEDNTHIWYQNGQIHREDNDQPAYMSKYLLKWYNHGELHRITVDNNGNLQPAVIFTNIYDNTIEKLFYINGNQINPLNFDINLI